jgi:hypothetical protein
VPPPVLPDAAAQQQAAVEVFTQHEPPLYEAYLEMMLEWLAAVRVAMFAGGIARLALMPDPMTVFSQGPKWAALAAKYTAQVARDVLSAPYRDLFADGTLFDSRPFTRNWIADTDNRLSAVPQQVFGLVSHIIDSATVNGASIPDVQQQIEQLFSDTGVQQWKNRARTVARTEVVGAYNGGLHDAFSLVVDSDPGTKYVHRWLATEDQRTRPDHREADGQAQPWGEPFQLGPGGLVLMMHPHALGAPADQVVNCRCVELLEEEGEPTPMGNRQYLSASFNPFQKRNKDGEWTKEGGGGSLKSLLRKGSKSEPAPAPKAAPAPAPEPEPEPWVPPPAKPRDKARVKQTGLVGHPEDWTKENKDPRYRSAASAQEAMEEFDPIDSIDGPTRVALTRYTGEEYKVINQSIRTGSPLTGQEAETRAALDKATKPAKRNKDVLLWRGMANGDRRFGDAFNGDMTGIEWTQDAFSSTSADFGSAAGYAFGRKNPFIMRVLLPREVAAGGVDMRGDANFNSHEAEVLLNRGLRYRVTADHGVNKAGMRYIDVEVVS